MKHYADPQHVANAEFDWELLVERADCSDEEAWLVRGSEDNLDRWRRLADAAAHAAFTAGLHASRTPNAA